MSDFVKSRPQRLCLMCGKCCRVATTYISYDQLLEIAKNGDDGAKDFLKIFEPYPSTEAAREVCAPIVDNIIEKLKDSPNPPDKLTFYKCRYIGDDNLCGIYKDRPELCERFPSSPWAVVPPNCGYEGWLFQKREEIKQKIRKQKEIAVELKIQLKSIKNPDLIKRIEEALAKTNDIIEAYAQYGANDW